MRTWKVIFVPFWRTGERVVVVAVDGSAWSVGPWCAGLSG